MRRPSNPTTLSSPLALLRFRPGIAHACAVAVGLAAFGLSGCASDPEPRAELPVVEPEQPQFHAERLAEATQAKVAGDYDRALSMFQEVLADNPTISAAYIGMGDIHLARDDYDRAEPAYRRAARLEPESFDAQYGHAFSLQMLRRFSESVAAYHRALALDPEHVESNLNLATVYFRLEAYERAIEFAERAVIADPSRGSAHANLGTLYEMVGRDPEAIEQYIAALELMGNRPPLLMNLIQALGREKRYREAANTADTLTRIEPTAQAFERLGWCLFKLGDYEQSLAAYEAATEMSPDYWPAQNGIGVNALNMWLLGEQRDMAARIHARDAFRRSLQANPNQPRIVRLVLDYNL